MGLASARFPMVTGSTPPSSLASERSGADVGLEAATDDYVATVLRDKPDEAALLGSPVDDPDALDDVDAATP